MIKYKWSQRWFHPPVVSNTDFGVILEWDCYKWQGPMRWYFWDPGINLKAHLLMGLLLLLLRSTTPLSSLHFPSSLGALQLFPQWNMVIESHEVFFLLFCNSSGPNLCCHLPLFDNMGTFRWILVGPSSWLPSLPSPLPIPSPCRELLVVSWATCAVPPIPTRRASASSTATLVPGGDRS